MVLTLSVPCIWSSSWVLLSFDKSWKTYFNFLWLDFWRHKFIRKVHRPLKIRSYIKTRSQITFTSRSDLIKPLFLINKCNKIVFWTVKLKIFLNKLTKPFDYTYMLNRYKRVLLIICICASRAFTHSSLSNLWRVHQNSRILRLDLINLLLQFCNPINEFIFSLCINKTASAFHAFLMRSRSI